MKMQTIESLDIKKFQPEKTLYIIGNGFDLAHGVPSKYSDFKEFLIKDNSQLVNILENNIKNKKKLWADFEESLGRIDIKSILKKSYKIFTLIDNGTNARIAQSIEYGFEEINDILRELQYEFYKWVRNLEHPIINKKYEKVIMTNALFFSFNYTEFIEDLYVVKRDNINYIHGCRKYCDILILGHSIGTGVANIKFRSKNILNWFSSVADYNLVWIDEELTKNTTEIIANNESYFKSLSSIDTILILGHSLSNIDYPYFKEIFSANNDKNKVKWYISWYSKKDKNKAKKLIRYLKINKKNVILVKT